MRIVARGQAKNDISRGKWGRRPVSPFFNSRHTENGDTGLRPHSCSLIFRNFSLRDSYIELLKMHATVDSQAPSEQDFAVIYKTYYRRVFGLCRYLLNSFDAAEDATHEVFLRAQDKLASYDPALPFSRWLLGIAGHLCIDLLRRRGTERRLFELETGEGF